MLNEEVSTLIDKYLDETIQLEEQQRLRLLLEDPVHLRALHDRMNQELFSGTYAMEPGERSAAAISAYFKPVLAVPRRIPFLRKWGWAAAAVLLLFLGTYGWLQYDHSKKAGVAQTGHTIDVAPGKEGAVLTLADGSQVVLDSLGGGVIASQNGTQVLIKNGQLFYDPAGSAAGQLLYNTMSTPRGRQFSLVLPDGSKVWLNAASRLRFPVHFEGGERRVELTGEAYFEVAANKKMPFKVAVNGAEVQVLGTSFNINAYTNERTMEASLLEGSIQVLPPGHTGSVLPVLLTPGQQAKLVVPGQGAIGPAVTVVTADLEKVMAWKNGLFNFDNAGVEEVMRELERWYDIDVVYEKGIPDMHFLGAIGKDLTLAEALALLKGASVHFRIEEGKRLVILP
jgi:ferric-dicitrate binding protein FerR (iron transport regulator)